MQRILITGANRGVGFEMVRQYSRRSDVLIMATCRQPEQAAELNALAEKYTDKIVVVPLDIVSQQSIDESVSIVRQHVDGLDVLLNNAGIFPKDPASRNLGSLQAEAVAEVINVNAVAPLLVTQAYHDLLTQGDNPRVMMISSQMGSMFWTKSGGSYAYRMSKAAMNMAARTLSVDLRGDGITTVTVHPGWVQTDMGGQGADIMPEESARGIISLVDQLLPKDNGTFLKWTGEEHSW